MVDLDGKESYSRTVAITINCNEPFTIKVYPNPVKEKLIVNIYSPSAALLSIRLTDIAGKQLQVSNHTIVRGANQLNVNLSPGLSSGIYLLQVFNKNTNETTVIKLVKD
jgi:hypothetical protein